MLPNLRIRVDYVVAQDVAGKFSQGALTETLAREYSLDVEAVAEPVEKEWNEKKQASYSKRKARLAKEREKLAKAGKAKPEKKAKPETEALTKK